MDALEYLKAKTRMTKGCFLSSCEGCNFNRKNNGKNVSCVDLETIYPEQAVQIVEDWTKENPIMTNKDKYIEVTKEVFGDNFIQFCINNVPECRCKDFNYKDFNCKECKEY